MADLVNRRYIADWKVPTYDRIPPDVRLKINAYTSYLNDANIAYNPNKVTPEEVKILAADWNGILDPRFKGRIATSDQFVGGTYDTLSMFLDPRFADRYGLPFLKAIVAQKPVVYNDIVVPVDRVIAGEQDIAIWPSEGVEYVQYTAGAPIRWVHPKPTPAFGNTWFGVSQFAPHPYAARLFLNWMMGEEGAKSVQTRYGGMTVLMGYPDQRAVTKESWYMPITDRFWPDWELWGRAYTPVMENWRKMLHEGQ